MYVYQIFIRIFGTYNIIVLFLAKSQVFFKASYKFADVSR